MVLHVQQRYRPHQRSLGQDAEGPHQSGHDVVAVDEEGRMAVDLRHGLAEQHANDAAVAHAALLANRRRRLVQPDACARSAGVAGGHHGLQR
mmetsp:Transcript_3549/g.12246  ORF Transcript_3549/g.12246 Transcript_3549/m.12246 type:complete len:92 (-) Transcript_3549:22-297(-)